MGFTTGILESIEEKQAKRKNPLVLAYVGDTVFDLYVRTGLVKRSDESVNQLNRRACKTVNARAQAQAAETLRDVLTEEESEVYRRGRNAKSGTVPKNMDVQDYRKATGFEALLGYLFLSGKYERLEELVGIILSKEEEEHAESNA